jgi:hypothetical protein
VAAELFSLRPLLTGLHEIEQIFNIFRLRGTPDAASELRTAACWKDTFPQFRSRSVGAILKLDDHHTIDLLDQMLELSPSKRIRAHEALRHPLFLNLDESEAKFVHRTTAPTAPPPPTPATGRTLASLERERWFCWMFRIVAHQNWTISALFLAFHYYDVLQDENVDPAAKAGAALVVALKLIDGSVGGLFFWDRVLKCSADALLDAEAWLLRILQGRLYVPTAADFVAPQPKVLALVFLGMLSTDSTFAVSNEAALDLCSTGQTSDPVILRALAVPYTQYALETVQSCILTAAVLPTFEKMVACVPLSWFFG